MIRKAMSELVASMICWTVGPLLVLLAALLFVPTFPAYITLGSFTSAEVFRTLLSRGVAMCVAPVSIPTANKILTWR